MPKVILLELPQYSLNVYMSKSTNAFIPVQDECVYAPAFPMHSTPVQLVYMNICSSLTMHFTKV